MKRSKNENGFCVCVCVCVCVFVKEREISCLTGAEKNDFYFFSSVRF